MIINDSRIFAYKGAFGQDFFTNVFIGNTYIYRGYKKLSLAFTNEDPSFGFIASKRYWGDL